jgi:outer membrane protein
VVSRTSVAMFATLWLLAGVRVAAAVDVFRTSGQVPESPAFVALGAGVCKNDRPVGSLTLEVAVESALCNNPETRSAWIAVQERAAAVGASKSAYLPTLSASGQYVHDDAITRVRDHPELSTNYSSVVNSEGLSLGWLLYDFGGRKAKLKSAEALLSAAQASESAALQDTFADTAKFYYAARAANEQVLADQAITTDAQDSLRAAKERVSRGIAPITEQFQAQTSWEQALLAQTRDHGQALAAIGALANAMGLSPDTPLVLSDVEEGAVPDSEFKHAVSQLIDEAIKTHPAIVSARKQLEAARAGVTAAKADGRPSVRLVGEYSRNNEPVQLGLGLPHYPSTGRDGYVGIQLSVPIFSGFATTYQVRQAEAEVDMQQAALDKATQQVALQVWQSYQTLQTGTQNLQTSLDLEQVATAAWQSAQRRYQSGAGTVLELLSTQSALAQARQQRVQALADWRYERLALAASLGRLGAPSLKLDY